MTNTLPVLASLSVLLASGAAWSAELGTFEQKLDPTSSNTSDPRTFKQRYLLDMSYAKGADSPVIYYMCGEANCFDADDGEAQYPPLVQYEAAHFGAAVAMLEHRYFGESQPFDQLTAENLQYLKTEYAVEDLAGFQRWISQTKSLTGKWIAIGGSYSGSLAAYYRLKHPELVVGALASSAPVQAKADFDEYDHFVAEGLGSACLAATQNVNHLVEQSLNDPAHLALIQKLFAADAINDGLDFLALLSSASSIAVQYGQEQTFCANVLAAGDPLQNYATATSSMLGFMQETPLETTPQGSMSTLASDYEQGVGMRQWNYLTCTEFGYFSTPYPDPTQSAESSLLDLKYNESICNRLFGTSQLGDYDATNRMFYDLLLDPGTSRILFTNGSTDPWSSLSISHERGNDTNPNTQVYTIQGASHCDDLDYDPTQPSSGSLQGAVNLFTQLATQWLND
jgi:pimeloyl-ACP methyl ester carboxylesterase